MVLHARCLSYGQSVGGVLINIYMNQYVDMKFQSIHKSEKFLFAVIIIGLTMQCISFNKIFINKYELNIADRLRCEYIGQAIEDYQENTNNVITKIAFYVDQNITYPCYPDLYCYSDAMLSSFYTEWSNLTALNYYLNCNYEKLEPENQYKEHFEAKDWNCLSAEQLLFEGDTLHICVY